MFQAIILKNKIGSVKTTLLIIGGVVALVIIILFSIIINRKMLPLSFLHYKGQAQVADIQKEMSGLKNFDVNSTLTIKSDNVPSLSNQPLNFTSTVNGIVDRSNSKDPKSSGDFKLNLAVQGTSFEISGKYALADQKFYYDIENVPQGFPIDLSTIQNKWIYAPNDNILLLNNLGNIVTQKDLYKDVNLQGISVVNGSLVYDFNTVLAKNDLTSLVKEQSQSNSSNKIADAVYSDLQNLVSGMQGGSAEYYIGLFDHLPYQINLTVNNNTKVDSKNVSHTSVVLVNKLSNFNHTGSISIPTSAITLQQVH